MAMRLGEASEQDRQRRLRGLSLELVNTGSVDDVANILSDVASIVLGAVSVRLWTVEREVARLIDRDARVVVELADAFQPIAQAITTGQPLWSARLSTGAGDANEPRRIACVLPLVVDRVIGAVELAFATSHGFSIEDRAYLSAVAQQIAVAVDRVRLPVTWATGSSRLEVLEPALRRVLIVDDDAETAARFRAALEASGHEAVVVFNAQAALRIAAQYVADVAFVDVGLSSSNGYELATRLRAMPCWDTARIVAVVGHERSNARERARSAGFDQLVVKPLAADTIDAILRASRSDNHG